MVAQRLKASACNAGDLDSVPGLGRSPGKAGAGAVQTTKASRKQSSLSGKESAQGCIPKRLLGRPDEALGGGNQGPTLAGVEDGY